jgi:hypothetical protein
VVVTSGGGGWLDVGCWMLDVGLWQLDVAMWTHSWLERAGGKGEGLTRKREVVALIPSLFVHVAVSNFGLETQHPKNTNLSL